MASDDDSFQDQDSILYDVTMPYTGTYYLQVKTFVPTDFGIAQDTGVGRYELFAYSFAATPAASPAIDGIRHDAPGHGRRHADRRLGRRHPDRQLGQRPDRDRPGRCRCTADRARTRSTRSPPASPSPEARSP